jgi:hypothetical protein
MGVPLGSQRRAGAAVTAAAGLAVLAAAYGSTVTR